MKAMVVFCLGFFLLVGEKNRGWCGIGVAPEEEEEGCQRLPSHLQKTLGCLDFPLPHLQVSHMLHTKGESGLGLSLGLRPLGTQSLESWRKS